MAPLVAAITIQGRVRSANRAPHGMPGTACSRSAVPVTAATAISACRGRTRSAADEVNHEAASLISGPPNMESPVSRAFPVAA
jgi:hypothetical protein